MKNLWLVVIFIAGLVYFQHQSQSQDTVQVAVVTQPIERGTVFTPLLIEQVVELVEFPSASAPINSVSDMELVVGKVARIDLPTRTPILTNMLVTDTTQTAFIGSDLALFVPTGQRAVPVETRLLGELPPTPFTCVEVVANLNFGEAGTSTFPIAAGVEILAISSEIITLALLPEEAVVLVWAQDNALPVRLQPASCSG